MAIRHYYDNLRDRITLLLSKGVGLKRIAIEAELGEQTLRNYRKPDWNPTRLTVEALESVLDRLEVEYLTPDDRRKIPRVRVVREIVRDKPPPGTLVTGFKRTTTQRQAS